MHTFEAIEKSKIRHCLLIVRHHLGETAVIDQCIVFHLIICTLTKIVLKTRN